MRIYIGKLDEPWKFFLNTEREQGTVIYARGGLIIATLSEYDIVRRATDKMYIGHVLLDGKAFYGNLLIGQSETLHVKNETNEVIGYIRPGGQITTQNGTICTVNERLNVYNSAGRLSGELLPDGTCRIDATIHTIPHARPLGVYSAIAAILLRELNA